MADRDIKATLRIETRTAENNVKNVQRTVETASKQTTQFAQQAQQAIGGVSQAISAVQQAAGGGLGGLAKFATSPAGIIAGVGIGGAAIALGPGASGAVNAAQVNIGRFMRGHAVGVGAALGELGARLQGEEAARQQEASNLGLADAFANADQHRALVGIVNLKSILGGLQAQGRERLIQASVSGNFNQTVDANKAMQRLTDTLRQNSTPAATGNMQR
jgi:hypothetical protein